MADGGLVCVLDVFEGVAEAAEDFLLSMLLTFFPLSLIVKQNKLECLSSAIIFSG